jgi:hypothetical protein
MNFYKIHRYSDKIHGYSDKIHKSLYKLQLKSTGFNYQHYKRFSLPIYYKNCHSIYVTI